MLGAGGQRRTKTKTQQEKQENTEGGNESKKKKTTKGQVNLEEREDATRTKKGKRPDMKWLLPRPSDLAPNYNHPASPDPVPTWPAAQPVSSFVPPKAHTSRGLPLEVNTGLLSLGPPASAENRVWPHRPPKLQVETLGQTTGPVRLGTSRNAGATATCALFFNFFFLINI